MSDALCSCGWKGPAAVPDMACPQCKASPGIMERWRRRQEKKRLRELEQSPVWQCGCAAPGERFASSRPCPDCERKDWRASHPCPPVLTIGIVETGRVVTYRIPRNAKRRPMAGRR
jgi:hypothetical protein